MSTRGLLSLRCGGREFITYQQSDAYPRGLGARIVRFALDHLDSPEAIAAFTRRAARVVWSTGVPGARGARPQGADLLEAILRGDLAQGFADRDPFRMCLDCEFAYVLDLDTEVLEFWELPDRAEAFPLATLSPYAVEEMECARSR